MGGVVAVIAPRVGGAQLSDGTRTLMSSPRKPQPTPDGHHLVIDGRRWRASDPSIPDTFRAELVAELMTARRLGQDGPATARPRVHDAKVALGERGRPWWEVGDDHDRQARVEAVIRCLLRHGGGGSICPSDVARTVGGSSWRDLMAEVRAVVWRLAGEDVVLVTQGGRTVGPASKGPIRVVPGPAFPLPG